MNTHRFRKLLTLATGFAIVGCSVYAGAQSVHHDKMDLRAAKADLVRLQKDRKRALRYQNWSKVAQDDRLIASDRLFIRKDIHKIKRANN